MAPQAFLSPGRSASSATAVLNSLVFESMTSVFAGSGARAPVPAATTVWKSSEPLIRSHVDAARRLQQFDVMGAPRAAFGVDEIDVGEMVRGEPGLCPGPLYCA